MNRRKFLKGLLLVPIAPAIVKADNIMKIFVPKIEIGPWHVNAVTGDIRYIGAPDKTYTVLELHRYLMDLADNPTMMGIDPTVLDITSKMPSTRKDDHLVYFNDSYNIDDKAAKHLYDGTIIQRNNKEMYMGNIDVIGNILKL